MPVMNSTAYRSAVAWACVVTDGAGPVNEKRLNRTEPLVGHIPRSSGELRLRHAPYRAARNVPETEGCENVGRRHITVIDSGCPPAYAADRRINMSRKLRIALGFFAVFVFAAVAVSAQQAGGGFVTVNVTAYYYGFDPGEVVVREGDRVRLVVRNDPDRKMPELVQFPTGEQFPNHGLAIDEFGVDTDVIVPYETVIVEFIADRPGTFVMYCSIWCGNGMLRGEVQYGHRQQVASLVVLPAGDG